MGGRRIKYGSAHCLSGYTGKYVQEIYEKMLVFAERKNLKLKGFAFESGMNDFAITDENDYVTKVEIAVEESL